MNGFSHPVNMGDNLIVIILTNLLEKTGAEKTIPLKKKDQEKMTAYS